MKCKNYKILIILFVFAYLVSFNFISSTFATDVDYNVPYSEATGPIIDGNITAAEWASASKYALSFQFNDTGNPSIKFDLYLLHNGSALFIGINMTLADNQSDIADAIYIYFDEEHDEVLAGNSTHPKEAGLKLTRDGNFTDLSYDGSMWINDEDIENLTKGPSNGVTNGITEWEFVVLSSYDPVNKISKNSSDFDVNLPSNVLEAAVTIGFDIEYYDADIQQYDSFTTTLNKTVNSTPSLWDNLVFAQVPWSAPNTSAIWGFIIIAMIVPAGLIVYMILWLKRKEVE
ncbi:MAG: hypothetical protein ACTSYB_02905 [Candidatus Helarchaeota archaeon]